MASNNAGAPANIDPNANAVKPVSKANRPVARWLTGEYLWELLRVIAYDEAPHGVERDLVRQFIEIQDAGCHDERLPLTAECVLIREQAFKYGRADIVAYHSDGSATVIEAKDGTKGYSHVIGGIGQATLYAVQLANTKGALTSVRRALLWSSTGSLELDGVIEDACERAGVVALPMPSISLMQAMNETGRRMAANKKDAGHGCA